MHPKVKSTQQLGATNACKVIVYGDSGDGKTRLCASAPAPFIISAEKGLMSLRKVNIPAWEISRIADLVEVFKYLSSATEARQFRTICLDSVSDIAETLFAELNKKHKDGRQLYPEFQLKMAQAFRDFRDIPNRHVVLLAKQETITDKMGAQTFRPMFPGKQLTMQAPYFVDEVFRLYTWTDARGRWWGLQTQPGNGYVAKDRSGMLAELENADPATGGGLDYVFRKMLS